MKSPRLVALPLRGRRLSFFLLSVVLVVGATSPAAAEPPAPIEGWLSVLWGDVPPGTPEGTVTPLAPQRLMLTDDHGVTTRLSTSGTLFAGVHRWDGRRVTVFPVPSDSTDKSAEPNDGLKVAAIRLGKSTPRASVSGSQPWVSLPCKFADVSTEQRDQAYFQTMYANAPGRLDHYWREVSADQIDITGSIAIDWVELPGNQRDYVPTPGSGSDADLSAIFNDCTAAANALVDFSGGGTPFVGINMMLNASLDCCAWGGSRHATLDGVTKSWRTTWNPPWAFTSVAVIAHEMGHGFGLPHANNGDGDSDPYDSPWDVMSSAHGHATFDPVYGRQGKHINAYHKARLGWFAAARRFETPPDSRTTITLDHTALAGSTNYQMARIPISADRWYTVEARLRTGDYEAALPGNAVILHDVELGRGEPSWAIDSDSPPADYGSNAGTMWTVGETFTDAANDISVSIDRATADGFEVTIISGTPPTIFFDGFETAGLDGWTTSVQ